MNKFNKNLKAERLKNTGFTIVETLVAVSILTLSILAGFTAVQNSLKSSISAKDQITVFYLIQDAMEYIKNTRDENSLKFLNGASTTGWLDGLFTISDGAGSGPCGTGKTCRIDTWADTATDCSGSCPNLSQDTTVGSPAKGLFGYTGGWSQTNFNRSIQIQEIVSGEEVRITITISWTQGSVAKTFQITADLFNRLQ